MDHPSHDGQNRKRVNDFEDSTDDSKQPKLHGGSSRSILNPTDPTDPIAADKAYVERNLQSKSPTYLLLQYSSIQGPGRPALCKAKFCLVREETGWQGISSKYRIELVRYLNEVARGAYGEIVTGDNGIPIAAPRPRKGESNVPAT